MVQQHTFQVPFHAVRGCREFTHAATDVQVGQIIPCVQPSIIKAEPLDVGTPFEQRQKGHIEAQTADSGQRVASVECLHAVHGQVQRKSQAHTLNADA